MPVSDIFYFYSNMDEFLIKYPGKFLVIKCSEVVGVYSSIESAEANMIGEDKDSYIIRQCALDLGGGGGNNGGNSGVDLGDYETKGGNPK